MSKTKDKAQELYERTYSILEDMDAGVIVPQNNLQIMGLEGAAWALSAALGQDEGDEDGDSFEAVLEKWEDARYKIEEVNGL